MDNNHTLAKLFSPILIILMFIAPFFYLPTLAIPFLASKQLLLVVSTIFLLLLMTLKLAFSGKIVYARSSLNLPLILFALSIIITLIIHPSGRLESLLGRGSLYLAAIALAYFAQLISSTKIKHIFQTSIVITALILALHGLLQLTWLYQLDNLPSFLQVRDFTLTGSLLATLTLLTLGLASSLSFAIKTGSILIKYLAYTTATIILLSLTAYLALIFSDHLVLLLPYRASWMLLLESFKNPLTILTGVGFSGFSSFYTAAKPLYLNNTSFWNLSPSSLSSEFMHLSLTGGILSALTLIWGFLTALHSTANNQALKITLLICFVSLILLPASPVVIIITFLALGLASSDSTHSLSLSARYKLAVSVIFFLAVLSLGYFVGKFTLASYHNYLSTKAYESGDGKKVYEEQLKALRLLPRFTSYRITYSRINLSLASALASKTTLSDEERQQVATLVSQAVREGKAAVELMPGSSEAWQNLGFIYRNLIGVAEGAEDFALASYGQAVALDPGNPVLRVELGGLLYQLYQKDTKEASLLTRAAQEFQTAVQLKGDYANAYYNLSKVFEVAGNNESAYQAMQKAVASLSPDSSDLDKATSELDALKAKLPAPSPSPDASPVPSASPESTDLSEPSPLPSPLPGGEIELPEGSPQP